MTLKRKEKIMSNQLAVIIAFDAESKKWGRYNWNNDDEKLVLAKEFHDEVHTMLAIDNYDRYFKEGLNENEIKKIQNLVLAFLSQSAYRK